MPSVTRVSAFLVLTTALLAASGCGSVSLVYPDQSNVQFQVIDLTIGTGAVAATGNTATVTYSLWLYDDTATDHKGSPVAGNQNATFPDVLGSGAVIPGFDQAVIGMAVGGARRAIVPPSLAYGSQGNSDGSIPPNAALVFDIQLVSLQ